MFALGLLTITACLLCLLLTPLARDWSIRLGLVDRPDHKRKIHPAATPRTGGIPILLSYGGAYAFLLLLPLSASAIVAANRAMIGHLLPPVGLIFLTGLCGRTGSASSPGRNCSGRWAPRHGRGKRACA